jgi:hypothetical protein
MAELPPPRMKILIPSAFCPLPYLPRSPNEKISQPCMKKVMKKQSKVY